MPRKSLKSDTVIEPEVVPAKTGRKTKYQPFYCDVAYEVMRLGCSVVRLSEILGVDNQTIENWRAVHPLFFEAIKNGRWLHDTTKIEYGLKQRAEGYEYIEKTIEGYALIDDDGNEVFHVEETVAGNRRKNAHKRFRVGTKQKHVHKRMAPDIGAICFWLCNRNAAEWKNVQRQEVVVKTKEEAPAVLDLTKLKRSDLEQLKNIITQAAATGTDGNGEGSEQRASEDKLIPFRAAALAIRGS